MEQSDLDLTDNEIENARISTLAPTTDKVIDEESYFNVKGDPMAAKFVAGIKAKDEARRRRLAAPGALGLPLLLDKRRLEFLIPDGVFREQPIYDRIYVFQISMWGDADTYGDTQIVMPTVTKDAEKHSNPRGVLLSAGPIALDEFRSNGVELGHIVTFIKLAPYRLQTGTHEGHDDHVMLMRACDLIASEDLARELREDEKRIEEFTVKKDGRKFVTHIIRDARRAEPWHPQQPFIPEDM